MNQSKPNKKGKARREAETRLPSAWKENHGNLLVLFVCLVMAAGSAVLWYQQNRVIESPTLEYAPTDMPPDEEVPSFNPEDALIISVTGAGSDLGQMRIAIYDSKENFNDLEHALVRLKSVVIAGETKFLLPYSALPKKLAIAVFHDENDDSLLNLNRLGIPSERYGFSGDARKLVGPPEFEDALIELPPAGEPIELFIR